MQINNVENKRKDKVNGSTRESILTIKSNSVCVGADALVCLVKNEIQLGGNGFCPYNEKISNKHVGEDSISTQNGITLIALIITIIIMLILAGVVISLTLGDKGLFKIAKNAAKNYANAEENERNQINEFENFVQNELNKDKQDIYTKLKVGDYVNYPVYYDNVQITNSYSKDSWTPKDNYNGWRILSIDQENRSVRLISAGIPLSYNHKDVNNVSVYNLRVNFFSTPIMQSTYYSFDSCVFKTAKNGTTITNISDLKLLFANNFTSVYAEGETYTDNGKTYTYTAGNPKVQSITKEDIDTLLGYTTENATSFDTTNDLLIIESTGTSFSVVPFYTASANSDGIGMYAIGNDANNNPIMVDGACWGSCGVRPVVTLKTNVKFTKANSNINNTQTWDIEI